MSTAMVQTGRILTEDQPITIAQAAAALEAMSPSAAYTTEVEMEAQDQVIVAQALVTVAQALVTVAPVLVAPALVTVAQALVIVAPVLVAQALVIVAPALVTAAQAPAGTAVPATVAQAQSLITLAHSMTPLALLTCASPSSTPTNTKAPSKQRPRLWSHLKPCASP